MMYVVQRPYGGGSEAGGQKRSEDTCRYISQNFNHTHLLGDYRQRRRGKHGLNIWARRLDTSEFCEINGLRIGGDGLWVRLRRRRWQDERWNREDRQTFDGNTGRRPGECISHNIFGSWCMPDVCGEL
jgi:hypothetical protein